MRDAGCRCIQIEEPTLHFMANTYGRDHEQVKFMIEAYNREVQGLDDVELWIHTCWGNPNMQRVIEDDSYRESFQIVSGSLPRRRVDAGDEGPQLPGDRTVRAVQGKSEEEDLHRRGQPPLAPGRAAGRGGRVHPPGAAAHRARAADRFERLRLRPTGLQSRDRLLQNLGIAQGANLVRHELGLPTTSVRAADPRLQTDIVPRTPDG